jgi:IS605 OrfB family transposase
VLPEAVKAVVGEVWQPTEAKKLRLQEVRDAWRGMTQHSYMERRLVAPELHSVYARNRFKSKGADDPVYFAHYDLNVKRTRNKHCKVWVQIPYKPHHPIWLPLRIGKQAEAVLFASRLRDSKLVPGHDGRFWMHFTVTREVTTIQPQAVLAVDLGEKRLATTVLLTKEGLHEPRFYGKRARGIRRHYAWLRRRLGERKLLRVIRKVKDTERRKINTLCHQISYAIVTQAKQNNAAIVLGDLKDIRRKARGRRMNRIIANMPYFKLTRQIEYKANWEGIPVYLVSERGTSKTCHRCGSTDTSRLVQSVLECHSCGLVYNADLNGAMNIAKRFWEQAFQNGAAGSTPLTLPEPNLRAHDEERSYQTKR